MAEDQSGLLGEARRDKYRCDHRPEVQGYKDCRYRQLLGSADLFVGTRRRPDLFRELAPRIFDLTGCDFLNFSLHDPSQNCMITHYWKKNQESGEFDAFAVDQCVSGWVWMHQEAFVIPDVERETRLPECMQVLRRHGVRWYSMLPMSTSSHRFGALGLGKSVPEVGGVEEVEFFQRVAFMVALTLENQEAHHAGEEQRDRLQDLVTISRDLSSSLDVEALAKSAISNLRRILGHDHTVLKLLEPDGKTLTRYEVESPPWEAYQAQGDHVPLEQAISARAIETRSVTFWSAEQLSNLGTPLAHALRAGGIQCFCNVPLIAGGQVWGSLNLGSVRKDAFSQPDVEYLQQVANQIAAAFRNASAYREIAQLKDRLAGEKRYLESEIRSEMRWDEMVGSSPALKRVLDYASIVADTDSTVLITGETGTGKERVARAIHGMSRRKDRSFIKLNCAAIPTGLLESELFGHEKGAFTGAVSQKMGRLELADKGTLFLDEIGEIPLELQPKLLRVLQDQEFERLGGTRTIRVDARLIAATNRDLIRAVEEKQFRSDLFYRLHVFPLHLPALRERREDIPLLVRHFVEKSSARLNRRIEFIPDEVIEAMLKWSWPGNIRELENFIERSVILSEGNVLRPPLAELRQEISRQRIGPEGTLRDMEREHIIEILRQTRGVLSGPGGAASRLGLKRTTLQYKMQKLDISRLESLD
ncbi:MAG: sigma 54-interacting transcriptional regulator [Terriglobales bacterium]